MSVLFETEVQKTVVFAMRADQIKRGYEVSEIFMYKVFGVSRPTWTAEKRISRTESKSRVYAIDGAGYNVYVSPMYL